MSKTEMNGTVQRRGIDSRTYGFIRADDTGDIYYFSVPFGLSLDDRIVGQRVTFSVPAPWSRDAENVVFRDAMLQPRVTS